MIRLISFLFVILPLLSHSSISVKGGFSVNKTCPAYLSKNKKTNPDNLMIEPGQFYPIREANRLIHPDWFRIELKDNNTRTTLRWVNAECGQYNYQTIGKAVCNQSPGLADSYVLALSWQPAFCQAYGYQTGKPECRKLTANSYPASHLVLHGLWPNQDRCGQDYGFCKVEAQREFCDYTPLKLNESVASNLKELMPGYAHGSCLERHEWYKHGSCQALSVDEYFSLAMQLNREANKTVLGQFLHNHLGETVKRSELREKVRESFGSDASRKVYLGCKKGLLVDVYIQLPALIPPMESLQSLVKKAPDFQHYESCPGRITISDFNNQSWF